MTRFVSFQQSRGYGANEGVFVNPDDVAAVLPHARGAVDDNLSDIVLRAGEKIPVLPAPAQVTERLG